ncbi:MAG TPA: acetyltransferase [Burkholderiales bacterium]|nr:acetyltransferase [Burkholderiales bacterium]
MDKQPALVVVGASGHAKVVIDIVEKEGRYRISHLLDDNPALHGKSFFGYRVAGATAGILAGAAGEKPLALIAIGDNGTRMRIASWLRGNGVGLARAVHPQSQIGRGAAIGDGTVIMAGAVVNSDAAIGENVIVNTGATVDHDCVVGDGVHLAPGVHLCGGVRIGAGAFLGAGSVVIPGIRVGGNAIVGAGSTLLEDVPENVKAAGSPARKLSA